MENRLAERWPVFSINIHITENNCLWRLNAALNGAEKKAVISMEKVRQILVDAKNVKGKNTRTALRCISAARAALLLRSGHQKHLVQAVRECGFEYLRFHGIFQDDMGVYREEADGTPIYSWQYVDEVYDFLLENNVRPFVVFDFMPAALASGDKTVYWEKANITLPASYEKWAELIFQTVSHFTERYGQEEVKKWYFEVWNEPDNPPFFTGSLEEYCRLYEVTARSVKKVSGSYRVGGPAIAGQVSWVKYLIQYCADKSIPLDFISAHNYSAKSFQESPGTAPVHGIPAWMPGPSWPLGNLCYDPCGLEQAVKDIKKVVADSVMPSLEIHFTEWGLSYDYWDPIRDSYHAASYLLSRLHTVEESVDSISYCEVSDVFEEDGPPTGAFHGGFGLINLQGIRKPAFYAYRYLAQMGEERLKTDDPASIACRDDQGMQILVWNDAVRQDKENKLYYCREQQARFAGRLQIIVSGVKPGHYVLQVYGVGYQKNDPYTMYIRMDCQGSLSKKQTSLLHSFSSDNPLHMRLLTIPEGEASVLVLDTDEYENDVFLIKLIQLF